MKVFTTEEIYKYGIAEQMNQDFWAWYKDGNVVVKVGEGYTKYFATQDAQYRNRIALTWTALLEYYTKEFINQ
tara:strand:+ start:42 stop:260 length:219 start_codon:yes stop_codon:yes gene_type:complete